MKIKHDNRKTFFLFTSLEDVCKTHWGAFSGREFLYCLLTTWKGIDSDSVLTWKTPSLKEAFTFSDLYNFLVKARRIVGKPNCEKKKIAHERKTPNVKVFVKAKWAVLWIVEFA